MNTTLDDAILGAGFGGGRTSAYLDLSSQEKGELIFKEIKNSYVFWSIKKAIKDEIIKQKAAKAHDVAEMIPRLLRDLSLETKIKNKVHEILDKNGYFRDTFQMTATKFKNCRNMSQLPQFFFDRDYEPLENVATARRQWDEILKGKLMSAVRSSRKPYMRPKRQIKVEKKKEEPAETAERSDDDASSGSGTDTRDVSFTQPTVTTAMRAPQFLPGQEYIYESSALLEQLGKISNGNYAGDPALLWGEIKLQLQTRSLPELRRKFHELNVTLKQIGIDEEKSFVDERIVIGERLLAKDYQPFLVQYAKRGIPPTLRCRVYKKILYADVSHKEVDYLSSLSEQFKHWESAIDDIVQHEILQQCNDDKYFIFQDMMEACLHLFFRDR